MPWHVSIKNMKKNKSCDTASKFAAGAALGAVVAAGAALFFTQTKTGKKVVKDAHKHAANLGKEVVKKAEKAKTLTEKKYHKIVDEVVEDYAGKKKLAKDVSGKLKTDLKKNWTKVKKEL